MKRRQIRQRPFPRYCEERGQKHKLRLEQSVLKDLSRLLPSQAAFLDTCEVKDDDLDYGNDGLDD